LTALGDDTDPMEWQIKTTGAGLYEFTRDVAAKVTGTGVLTLFVQHTSCSLLIQENADHEVQTDLAAFFDLLVPPSDHPQMSYLKHTYEGPDDMPAHIKAAMLPTSLQIPVILGEMQLGTWQGIFIFEHRTVPHLRRVVGMMG
jgi:secondary thiamine-phosphate synthase enzyme